MDSIINQTYRNLQIILVDDGSPDNCGAICDEYASKDSRIEVIHQENGGVSAARNAGLKLAAGDYIGWVDSDDWIEPDMYAYMLENMQKYEADIAVCSRLECFKERKRFKGWHQIVLLDMEQALERLLQSDEMNNLLWDKLWRKDLFLVSFFRRVGPLRILRLCIYSLPRRKKLFVCRKLNITIVNGWVVL